MAQAGTGSRGFQRLEAQQHLHDRETCLWYSHWDCDGEFRNQDIGLTTLRRDGFGYVTNQKADAPAQCETASFDRSVGMRFFVHAGGVTAEAPLKIELLNDHAQSMLAALDESLAAVAAIHERGARRTESGVTTAAPGFARLV